MFYRHGDVILVKVETTGKEYDLASKSKILARGEVTGHAHRTRKSYMHDIVDPAAVLQETQKQAESLQLSSEDLRGILRVTQEIDELTHEEHGTLSIPKGEYAVILQREWTGEMEERVYD